MLCLWTNNFRLTDGGHRQKGPKRASYFTGWFLLQLFYVYHLFPSPLLHTDGGSIVSSHKIHQNCLHENSRFVFRISELRIKNIAKTRQNFFESRVFFCVERTRFRTSWFLPTVWIYFIEIVNCGLFSNIPLEFWNLRFRIKLWHLLKHFDKYYCMILMYGYWWGFITRNNRIAHALSKKEFWLIKWCLLIRSNLF